ncbi:MAG: sulfite exporter TauE/SafE family protein [Hyphomicrobiales bacterium]
MFDSFLDTNFLYFIFLIIFLISGMVKGVTGIGLPMTSITLLIFFINPLQAIGLNMVPVIVANITQFLSAQSPLKTAKKYYLFGIFMVAGILITSVQAATLGDDLIKLLIGLMVMIFALDNLFRRSWSFDLKYDKYWQIGMGSLAGVVGGLTSIWGIPIIIYLILRKASKEDFVDSTGFLFLIASVPATYGYYKTDVFSLEMIPIAALCAVTAIIGMRLGRIVRRRIDADTFKKYLLLLFLLIGIRMIWSAMGGI